MTWGSMLLEGRCGRWQQDCFLKEVTVSVHEQLLCHRTLRRSSCSRAAAFYCALQDVINDITARQHLHVVLHVPVLLQVPGRVPVLAEAVCVVQAALSSINVMAFPKRALCSRMGDHDGSGPPIRCMTSIRSDMATRILSTSIDHQPEF